MWVPWAVFGALDVAAGRIGRGLVFVIIGVSITYLISQRCGRSSIRREGEIVVWRNWPEAAQTIDVKSIAGCRSGKGISRMHCELLISTNGGKVRRKPVWALSGDNAEQLAKMLRLPNATK